MGKISWTVQKLLFEAFRRNDMADEHERHKDITSRWLGLGTAAAYKQAIEGGYMRFFDGRTPPPRCMGWLCLTEKGAEALKELEPQFAEHLAYLKQTSYQNSYASRFVLAGGITKR